MSNRPSTLRRILDALSGDLSVTFELTDPQAKLPIQSTEGSAGYDAFACITKPVEVFEVGSDSPTLRAPTEKGLELRPQERAKIPLGIKFHLPQGWQADLRPRSGHAWKKGLTLANSLGLVDADYPEEYAALLQNTGTVPVYIQPNEKIVQINFQRFGQARFVKGSVRQTTNRASGFGHTGN